MTDRTLPEIVQEELVKNLTTLFEAGMEPRELIPVVEYCWQIATENRNRRGNKQIKGLLTSGGNTGT